MHGQDPGEHTDHLTLRQNKHSSSCLSCWRSTMVESHEISIFLRLLALNSSFVLVGVGWNASLSWSEVI